MAVAKGVRSCFNRRSHFWRNCYNDVMAISHAERRQIENEMIFRRRNEKIGNDLEALDALFIEDGYADLVSDEDLTVHFLCECSDENCDTRIPMRQSKYKKLHTDRDHFIVLPGHQVDPIEKVIKECRGYNVVLKNKSFAEPSGNLNETPINNS